MRLRPMRRLATLVVASVAPSISAAQHAPIADSIPLASITAGRLFTCGLNADGRAYCWGANQYAQLGTTPRRPDSCRDAASDGNRIPCALHPVAVATDLTFLAIDAGARHVCGIDTDSLAWCWGSNDKGQLATMNPLERCAVKLDFGRDVNDPCSHRPVPVFIGGNGPPPHFGEITSGDDLTCALAPADGSVWCWGTGRGSLPTRVEALAGARVISASDGVCALIANTARCVAYRSPMVSVQYAEQPSENFALPQLTSSLSHGRHDCAIAQSLGYCWGWNSDGELGIGRASDRQIVTTPMPVVGGHEFQQLEAGAGATCGVTTAGELYCWGHMRGMPEPDRCTRGGDPIASTNDCALHPVQLMRGIPVSSVAMGYLHACALTTSNVAYCWGGNADGELGNGTTRAGKQPVRVMGKPLSRLAALMLDLRDDPPGLLT